MRKWLKGAVAALSLLVLAAIAALVATGVMYGHVSARSGQIRRDMSMAEVRRVFDGLLVESPASLEQVERDGYSLEHYPELREDAPRVMKYSHHLWRPLYLYIIYGDDDQVKLVVEVFE